MIWTDGMAVNSADGKLWRVRTGKPAGGGAGAVIEWIRPADAPEPAVKVAPKAAPEKPAGHRYELADIRPGMSAREEEEILKQIRHGAPGA